MTSELLSDERIASYRQRMNTFGKVLLNEGTEFFEINGELLRAWEIDGRLWLSGVDIQDATGLHQLTRKPEAITEFKFIPLETPGGISSSKVVTIPGLIEIAFRLKVDPSKISRAALRAASLALYARNEARA
jgi:hypothetical protein